ncbi:MAG: hypothetical protein KF778_08080 [Rhodocyclaceae bacterium]|nr:hypothetical protein [Rhodocyclaceae bacterium]MBX3668348.1 hypothetical protein [Rhodocyclaceae bacterium]
MHWRSSTDYFARLAAGKVVLWCYLIWYIASVARHFDASPVLWLNSAGIGLVIGIALMLSVTGADGRSPRGWQAARLFMMPFGVSSFSVLIKGKGFVMVFPPDAGELALNLGLCTLFVLGVCGLKFGRRRAALDCALGEPTRRLG